MPFPALRNPIRAGVIVHLCLISLVVPSGTALAKPTMCPAAALKKARSLMADGKHEKALAAYAELEDKCLDVAEDLLDLTSAAAKLKRYRKAFHYNSLMAEHSPPDKRAHFLKQKEEELKLAPSCMVEIDTNPRGATVVVDNKEVGITKDAKPLALVLKGGKHSVSLRLEGHEILEAKFETEFGEDRVLSYTLKAYQPFKEPVPASKVPTAPKDNQPTPPITTPDDKQGTDDPEPQAEGRESGPFVGLLAGPAWTDYGAPDLSVGVAVEAGLDGGYVFRNMGGLSWLGVQVHGTLLWSPVNDSGADEMSHFISLLAGVGARFSFWQMWTDIRISVGAAILTGASEKSFFFAGASEVSGAFANVTMRAAAGLGWTFYKGLYVAVYPVAIDYTPRFADFNDSIGQVFRYQLAVAAGWEG